MRNRLCVSDSFFDLARFVALVVGVGFLFGHFYSSRTAEKPSVASVGSSTEVGAEGDAAENEQDTSYYSEYKRGFLAAQEQFGKRISFSYKSPSDRAYKYTSNYDESADSGGSGYADGYHRATMLIHRPQGECPAFSHETHDAGSRFFLEFSR